MKVGRIVDLAAVSGTVAVFGAGLHETVDENNWQAI